MNDKIKKLRLSDPIVNKCLALYINGDLAYTQALEVAVIALSEQHSILQRKVIECREQLPPNKPLNPN